MKHRNRIAWLGLVAIAAAAPALAGTRIERDLPLDPGGAVEIDTDAGSVSVKGAGRSGVHVVVTSKDANLEQYWDFRFESADGVARIVAERKEEYKRGHSRIPSPSFELEVPVRASLSVDTAGGSVHVDSLEGAVDVDTAGGNIEVSDVKGNVSLDTAGGSIDVRSIQGTVRADTSGGSIHMERVSGDLSADTSGGSIRVTEAGGRVDADTSGGSIDVTFSRGNASGGALETMGGGIRVAVDPTVGLDIDASTMGGTVSSALPITVQGKVKKSALRGKLGGGGASLTASTMGGSIRIEPL